MSKFKKGGGKSMPAISTASLPDIVFMLLFFFMVTTVMRETTLKIEVKPPEATEVKRWKKIFSKLYLYRFSYTISTKQLSEQSRIQLNDVTFEKRSR